MPGLLDGPELAPEVAKLERLSGEWENRDYRGIVDTMGGDGKVVREAWRVGCMIPMRSGMIRLKRKPLSSLIVLFRMPIVTIHRFNLKCLLLIWTGNGNFLDMVYAEGDEGSLERGTRRARSRSGGGSSNVTPAARLETRENFLRITGRMDD